MQPFLQIMKDDPTRVRILQHLIERYAEGNTKVYPYGFAEGL
nr:hypothetical protein [uncultured Prevotella sp.]